MMKKLKTDKIIGYISLLLLLVIILSNVEVLPLVAFALAFGYVTALPFMWFTKKINNTKLTRFAFYSSFIIMFFLSTYHIIKTYSDYLKDFRGFRDFEQFVYYNPFGFSTFPSRFIWETFVLIVMADLFFIGIALGFMINLYLNISSIEIKKRES